jgi:hypothetical protein
VCIAEPFGEEVERAGPPLTQTEDAWEAGHRQVMCFLTAADGPSTGSAAGSRR